MKYRIRLKFGEGFYLSAREILIGVCLMLISTLSHALSLGELDVQSKLNQPLDASVPVIASNEELVTLKVKLASDTAFERLHIPKHKLLNLLSFVIEDDQGKLYIKIISTKPIKEPMLEFIISLDWGNGRMLRTFAIFLSP